MCGVQLTDLHQGFFLLFTIIKVSVQQIWLEKVSMFKHCTINRKGFFRNSLMCKEALIKLSIGKKPVETIPCIKLPSCAKIIWPLCLFSALHLLQDLSWRKVTVNKKKILREPQILKCICIYKNTTCIINIFSYYYLIVIHMRTSL